LNKFWGKLGKNFSEKIIEAIADIK